jgi:hypothetical protein
MNAFAIGKHAGATKKDPAWGCLSPSEFRRAVASMPEHSSVQAVTLATRLGRDTKMDLLAPHGAPLQ